MLLQIERILSTAPPDQKGSYTVYQWQVSGWIDGNYAGDMVLQTLSGKEAKYVQPGWAGNVEIDTKYGTKYKIPTPPQGVPPQGQQQGLQPMPPTHAAPPPPQQSQPPPQAPQQAPPLVNAPPLPVQQPAPRLNFMDVVQAHARCIEAAIYNLSQHTQEVSDLAGLKESPWTSSNVLAAAASIFIECHKNNVQIPVKKEQAPEPHTITLINQALTAAQVDARDIPDDVMLQWWKEAGGNAEQFISRVNAEMTTPEAAAGEEDSENLPF